jgi:long-chain acyl-CoA synthetase
LLTGSTAFVCSRFTPAGLLELVRREAIQMLPGSPVIFPMLLTQPADRSALSSVQACFSSGAAIPPDVNRQLSDRFGIRVRQVYGMSETGTITMEASSDSIVAGVVGRPVHRVELRIVGPDDRDLPAGEPGEILVRSPAMTGGYLGEPELNRRMFFEGFLRTGDQGRLDDEGNLVLTGRSKRFINVGGTKLDPVEIEQVLESLPGVGRARVTGVSDPRFTELVKAIVAVRPGHDVTRASIIEHSRRHLAEMKIPRIIELVEARPEELTGKRSGVWSEEDPSGSRNRPARPDDE